MKLSPQQQHKHINTIQSILLIATMIIIMGALGWAIAGLPGLFVAIILCVLVTLFGPRVSPVLVLKMYRASELSPQTARGLYHIVGQISRNAGLARPPRLFYVPSRMLNAFAVGSREASAVALTDGLLRMLNQRELIGVLAHEISHIRHNDMWVMNLADVISRITLALSQFGLIAIPLALFNIIDLSLLSIILLIAAPTLIALLQLALSRTREYDADLGAVSLTGDPKGLASALQKLEHYQGNWLERVLLPGRREPDPAVLRTHPPISERIERLLTLSEENLPSPAVSIKPLPAVASNQRSLLSNLPVHNRRPRWHLNGLWY